MGILDGKQLFSSIESCTTYESQLPILDSRLYSPNLKDVAGLEDTQFIVNFPYICLLFFPVNHIYPAELTDVYGKLEKLTERLLYKLHTSNLVNTIFYLIF